MRVFVHQDELTVYLQGKWSFVETTKTTSVVSHHQTLLHRVKFFKAWWSGFWFIYVHPWPFVYKRLLNKYSRLLVWDFQWQYFTLCIRAVVQSVGSRISPKSSVEQGYPKKCFIQSPHRTFCIAVDC